MSFKIDNLAVYICSHVFKDTRAILLVSHDEDGDWQFLCGGSDHGNDVNDFYVVCLSHVIQRDKALLELEDLPKGWMAERASLTSPWTKYRAENTES